MQCGLQGARSQRKDPSLEDSEEEVEEKEIGAGADTCGGASINFGPRGGALVQANCSEAREFPVVK